MSAAAAPEVGATPLRLGTRRSALARAQSEMVAERLRETSGREVVLVEVTTRGDVDRAPLRQIGGTGVFVTALREALLEGRVDLAVHSMKDLPTAPADGLVLAAVPPREDPRDVLVAAGGAGLADLPPGARVGTGSPRRAAQLRALGLGLDVVDVRGNVDTRVGMVTSGRLDAVVLAAAGLARLGRSGEVTDVLDVEQVLPAPAQGALALECRADDEATALACAALDDPLARSATTAERALLGALEAGCSAPVGALARTDGGEGGGEMVLTAVAASHDGSRVLRCSARGDDADPVGLGRRLAADLLAQGAADLADVGPSAPGAGPRDEQLPLPGADPSGPGAAPSSSTPSAGSPSSPLLDDLPDPSASTPAPSPALPPAGSPSSDRPAHGAGPTPGAQPSEDARTSPVTAPTGPSAHRRPASSQESEA
ncbi:hydroxymethylbilane synthase [Pseudokineococcus marinus]|uniref:Porphobilinogen deaminase n=1 Tax=Pseudokineococcus marinus TaxID=351215 RepID=A0A849BNI1_9ACTN|nr:hydroxymethylbilane synthase [Pseudokineococcus marinus]NNH24760.1 hydroxymethylbilane synthase [Pseudokineococcus marinus]